MFKRSVFGVIALMAWQQAMAVDIAREVIQPDSGNNSYLDLGISLAAGKLPLVGLNDQDDVDSDGFLALQIGLEGRLQYKRAFVEVIENSFSNITLGLNAFATDNSTHELILTSQFDDVDRGDITGFETITDRQGDFNAGFRSSFFRGSNIVQFELIGDIVDSHNGASAALQFGRQKQYRNWNIHGLAGVRYFSDNVIDHFFGISDAEATAELPAYEAEGGFLPTIQIGATVPINEKWIFRATGDYLRFPDSVADSPLAQGDDAFQVQVGVYYVLYGG